ncbi:MAG TPA: M48 family metalloprotease [Candidatus Baltobacteraceae bacterium]|jgi:Zn-dependent protease with chaperone function|nr:M48 family metalloprotease [Candidatus Baltobacteraceae bacterium]
MGAAHAWMHLVVLVALSVPLALPSLALAAPTSVDSRVNILSAQELLHGNPHNLVNQRRQRMADVHMEYTRTLSLVGTILQIFALLLFWRSGRAARLRDALRRRIRSPALVRFLFGMACAAIVQFVSFPVLELERRVFVGFGISSLTFDAWWRERVVSFVCTMLLAGAATTLVVALVERVRLWYVFLAVILFSAIAASTVLGPLFSSDRTASVILPPSIVLPVAKIERGTGFCSDAPLLRWEIADRTAIARAKTDGFGATARILLGSRLLDSAPTDEVAYVAARESARCANGDGMRTALFSTFVLVLAILGAVLVADRIPFRFDDDALARLTLVAALIGVFQLALAPLDAAYDRRLIARADAVAIATSHDPASAVRDFVRIADEQFVPLCPSQPERLFFYHMPPLGTRIAAATGRPDPCH